MFGYEKIKVRAPMTLDELEAAIQQGWDPAWGPFFRGKTTPVSIGEYMIFPISSAFCVVAYPKKDVIKMNAAPMAEGFLTQFVEGETMGLVKLGPSVGQVRSQTEANKCTAAVKELVARALQPYLA